MIFVAKMYISWLPTHQVYTLRYPKLIQQKHSQKNDYCVVDWLKCHPHLGARLTNEGFNFSFFSNFHRYTKLEKNLNTRSNLTAQFKTTWSKDAENFINLGRKATKWIHHLSTFPKVWMTFFNSSWISINHGQPI